MKRVPINEFLRFMRERILNSARKILILDYDGTLAPFNPDPSRAVPYPGMTGLLRKIRDAGGIVLFLTGREPEEIVELIGLSPPFETWGCHGMVRLDSDGKRHAPVLPEYLLSALDETERLVKGIGTGRVERKAGGVALHWRDLDPKDRASLRRSVLAAFKGLDPVGLSALDFDGGIEFRIDGYDKGRAIREMLRDFTRRDFAVFLGDDATDEQGFSAAAGLGATGILVHPDFRKTGADYHLRPPGELRLFLESWLSGIEGEGASHD